MMEIGNVSDNESLWIELLVDNELTNEQTNSLMGYLDENPDGWKRCCTALLDDRLLRNGILADFQDQHGASLAGQTLPITGKPDAKIEVAPSHRAATLPWWSIAMVACLATLLGAIGHRMMQRPALEAQQLSAQNESAPSISETDLEKIRNLIRENNAELLGGKTDFAPTQFRQTPVSFELAYRPNTLVEIENTPTKAVYQIDHEVPGFLLDAIVRAGHQVDIRQDYVSVKNSDGKLIRIPVNTLEIVKFVGAKP